MHTIKFYSLEKVGGSSALVIMAIAATIKSWLCSAVLFIWACKDRHSVGSIHKKAPIIKRLTMCSSPSATVLSLE